MKRRLLLWHTGAVFAFVLTLVGGSRAVADVPTHYEEFIYSVVVYNGRDYSATFVRQPVNTLYLIAEKDNFVSARTTMVYYWPITGNYRLDTNTINHQFDGRLRITGNGINKTLSMEKYTYYNVHGEYELNWKVAKGPNAEKVYAQYQKSVKRYEQAVSAYQQAQATYQQKLNDLAQKITSVRQQGGDPSELIAELKNLKQPTPPARPTTYTAPPARPQSAFVVNLPVGVYHVELVNRDGTIMQGSDKRLVVFTADGAQQVGYDVIPADKWTRPESSELPGSVLYVVGSTDLYLRPFFEKRYNDLYHKKLVNNDARGNPNMESWVKLQQVPNARVILRMKRATRTERQQAFAVQQIQGSSLGYKIVPWQEGQHQPGAKPDIVAFHVPITPAQRIIHVSVRDQNGAILSGGDRQIRIVTGGGPRFVLVILILIPFVIGGIVIAVRSKHYDRHRRLSPR